MKSTLIIAGIFLAGLVTGSMVNLPDSAVLDGVKSSIVFILLFMIGIGVGADTEIFSRIKKMKLANLIVPVLIAAGSILGTAVISLCFPSMNFRTGMAVGAGFGFYSLSSIILTDLQGVELGTIALLTNMLRELLTILTAPLLVRWFGSLAPIASAGATSMDITLPVIQRFSGNQYTLLAIFNGVVLTILVPILVPIFGS